MRGGFNDLLKTGELGLGKPKDILPAVIGQVARRMVETVLFVRLFHVNFYAPIRPHFGMDDLCSIVQRQKWIHHKITHTLRFKSITRY